MVYRDNSKLALKCDNHSMCSSCPGMDMLRKTKSLNTNNQKCKKFQYK